MHITSEKTFPEFFSFIYSPHIPFWSRSVSERFFRNSDPSNVVTLDEIKFVFTFRLQRAEHLSEPYVLLAARHTHMVT